MAIDYAKMKREFPKQKASLTRAKKKGYAAVVESTRTIAQWNETGAWPDDWQHWERVLVETWWAERARFLKGEVEELPPLASMDDL